MIDDLRRALARPPTLLRATSGMSAVAAILVPGEREDLDLLLIRRAERASDPWSGHVSFPGGRVEPTDADPLAGAIRETREEIGLVLPSPSLLGQLDDVAAIGGRPGMVIRPFVFLLEGRLAAFATQIDEVASVHRLSLRHLLENRGRGRMLLDWRGQSRELPCVDFEGLRLWGLTLRMVDDLLHRLDGLGIGLERATDRPSDLVAGSSPRREP